MSPDAERPVPNQRVGLLVFAGLLVVALILAGVEVWISNHRSVEGILGYVRRLGALVGCAARADAYAVELAD